jgi:hypothetical protein
MNKGTIILVIFLSLLITPRMTIARKAPPQAKEFEVEYDKAPFEKVIAADRYRNELLKTGKEQKVLKDIYFDRARELYERALLEDDKFTYGHTSLGFLCLWASIDPYLSKRKGLLGRARDKFIRAISLRKSLYEGYYYLAVVDTVEKDWDSALNNLREYIRSERDDSYYHLLLGYIYASGKGEITKRSKVEFELAKERATDPVSVQWAIRQLKRPQKPEGIPPIRPPTPPRKEYFPGSVSLSIYVPAFVEKTGHGEIRKIPQLLSSRISETIFRNNRFTLLEKKAMEEGEYPVGVDSVLVGSIINVNLMGKTLLCHLKLIYPEGGNILFSKDFEIPYTDKPMLAIGDRDINRIVGEIEKNFIKSEGNIIQVSENYVTVNLGSENGIRPGFKGLVIGKTFQIVIPRTKEVITNEIYLGEIVFEQIEERVSKARILNPGRVTIQVGDLVRTK